MMRAELTIAEGQYDFAVFDDAENIVLRTSLTKGEFNDAKASRIVETMNEAFKIAGHLAPTVDAVDQIAKLERSRETQLQEIAQRQQSLESIDAKLAVLRPPKPDPEPEQEPDSPTAEAEE